MPPLTILLQYFSLDQNFAELKLLYKEGDTRPPVKSFIVWGGGTTPFNGGGGSTPFNRVVGYLFAVFCRNLLGTTERKVFWDPPYKPISGL